MAKKTEKIHVTAGEPVEDRLPERYSPSRVSTFMQCPAKFFYNTIAKMPQVATAAQLRGTLAHEAIEKVFELPAEERTPEATAAGVRPAWERLDAKDDTYANLRDEIEPILLEAEGMCRTWFGVEDPQRIEPKACETWVRGVVGGMPMHGIIDRLDELTLSSGKNVSVVSDYKSAIKIPKINDRFIDDKFFGMECYAAMMHSNGEAPAAIRLIFIAGGNPDSALFREITPQRLAGTNSKIKAAYSSIKSSAKSGEFDCKTGPLCGWCEYQDICPAFNEETVGVPVELPAKK